MGSRKTHETGSADVCTKRIIKNYISDKGSEQRCKPWYVNSTTLTAGYNQSRRFLKYVDDNALIKVRDNPLRGDHLLDLSLQNRHVKGDVRLSCSDQSGDENFEKSKQDK